jgi:hypothetical protein
LVELADYVIPFTIRVICDLRVADHLREGPRPVEELAAVTGTHAPALQRALRALAGKGIFTEVEPGWFGLTPLAEPLRSDHPLSLRQAYPLLAADIQAWARFDHSIRTGQAAFEYVHGQGYWEYLAANPEDSSRFDGTQQAATRLELRTMLPAYDGWAALGSVVDVGGGNGAFLAGLLARFKAMRGVLFDLPHVVAGAPDVLVGAGVADRCEIVGGSFFETVPAGSDVYLLKRVLYHWDDEQATTLLRAVRAAMRPDSRLLLFEPLAQPGNDFNAGKLYDLILLVMAGAGARSQDQIKDLLASANLRVTRVVPTFIVPIIEAVPA